MRDSLEKQYRYYQLGQDYFWLAAHYDVAWLKLQPYLERLRLQNKSRPLRILDAGCGPGNFISRLSGGGEIFGADFSLDALRFCAEKNRVATFSANLEQMPVGSESLNGVVALETLEHVQRDDRALGEIFRVLVPGGICLISVPAFMALWGDHDEMYGHYRRYGKKELIQKINSAGLEVLECSYFKAIFFIPLFVARQFKNMLRGKRPPRDDFYMINAWLNRIFRWLIVAEVRTGLASLLPFGTSLLCVVRKPV